ncbi:hypothetical protein ACQKK5_19395 [Brevibacillus panacihumi]|uniref:hypothetical protein n=1 Tax=Brevibacillus panacihumi TaxID=497735 RepID=UPI003D01BE9D
MEKEIWKWIITTIPDSQLITFISILNKGKKKQNRVAIKGLSDIERIREEQLKIFRNRIENEVLKPQNLIELQSLLKREMIDDFNLPDKSLGIDELYEYVTTTKASYTIVDLLMRLLISSDEQMREKAKKLYEKLQQDRELKQLPVNSDISDQNKEIAESVQLSDQFRHQIAKLTEEKNLLTKEIKTQKKMIEKLESELKEMNKELKKRDNELELRKNELSTRDKKIRDLMEKITALVESHGDQKNQIADLNTLLVQYKKEVEQFKTKLSSLNNEINLNKPSVVLIDNGNVIESLSKKKYNIMVLTPNDLENTVVFEQADQIWYATFRVTPQKRAKLKKLYGEKIVEFQDYHKLREYCNTGMVYQQ